MHLTQTCRSLGLALALMFAYLPHVARAQEAMTSSPGWSQIKDGDRIRVRVLAAPGDPTIETTIDGRFGGLLDDQLILSDDATRQTISLDRIDTVERRKGRGRAIGLGALIGGAAGVLLGAATGDDSGGFLEPSKGEAAVALGAVGAGAGALIGALSGGGWQRIDVGGVDGGITGLTGPRIRFTTIAGRHGGGLGLTVEF